MLSLHQQLPEARTPHEQTALQRQIEATDRKINPKTKRLRLSNNPDAIAKIKDMWKQTPRPSITGIAKEINYPKATTAENTKRLKEKGELADK